MVQAKDAAYGCQFVWQTCVCWVILSPFFFPAFRAYSVLHSAFFQYHQINPIRGWLTFFVVPSVLRKRSFISRSPAHLHDPSAYLPPRE